MNVAARAAGLSDFADDYLGGEPGVNLAFAGPASQRVLASTHSEAHTSPLIGTILWRCFLAAGGLNAFQEDYSEVMPKVDAVTDTFIVRHGAPQGDPRYDLLVF